MSGKVIDMFSRKPMDVPQNTEANDKRASEVGKYAGHIHADLASFVRTAGAIVESKSEKIDRMVAQWEKEYEDYFEMVVGVLHTLEQPMFDPRTHEMQISEEGHVWIVELADEDPS